MKLSIVVPCYNEAENIPLILRRFRDVIHRNDIEVILVDNGSQDNTSEILQHILPDYPFARSIRINLNQGYGFGIMQGLRAGTGDYLGWTHADMQTDPKDVIKAFKIIEKNKSKDILVKGYRKGRPLADRFFSFGMSIFETVYLRKKLFEINAQPNVFSRQFFDTWKNPPKDFNLDLYVLYMAQVQNLQVKRFCVSFPKRMYGQSFWGKGLKGRWRLIKSTVCFSRRFKKGVRCGIYRT